MQDNSRGNVLFLILIAVALFAALSYAVTNSSRTSGGSADTEKVSLQASRILQYATALENSLVRMRLSNNCNPEQVSFENPLSTAVGELYSNPNSPPNFSCHLFRPEGGGAIFDDLNGAISRYDWRGTDLKSQLMFSPVLISGIGTTEAELVFIIYGGISRALCTEINRKLGVPDNGATDPAWESDSTTNYTGTFSSYETHGISLGGNSSFCAYDQEHDVENNGAYFHVLLPR